MKGSRRQPPSARLPVLTASAAPVSRLLGGSMATTGLGGGLHADAGRTHRSDAAVPVGIKGLSSRSDLIAADAAAPGATAVTATTSVPLPPSRIPAAFHVRDASGRLVFPSERPEGDADVGLLAETLGGMLEEWRSRLDENKPSFPLGAARWGVLQMCIYDMWCTIEEARIWDIGLTECERLVHFHSPALSAMLGRLRLRLSQAFATVLSMSQRMQFELQRWHATWLEQGEKLRREETQRQALQQQVGQLQERISSLEEELTLYAAKAGGDPHPLEKAFHKMQNENIRLSQQLRGAHGKATSARSENLSLRLSNEALFEELARWRERGGEDPNSPPSPRKHDADAATPVDHPSGSDTRPLLELFASYEPRAQRVALDAILRVHEALTGEVIATPSSGRPATGLASAPPPIGAEAAGVHSFALPPDLSPPQRLQALEALTKTLSEAESQALLSAFTQS